MKRRPKPQPAIIAVRRLDGQLWFPPQTVEVPK